MPLDQDQINQKLAQLEEYLKQLGELKDKPRGDFTEKSMIEAAAEREVYKVCQQVIDIAQTINADWVLARRGFTGIYLPGLVIKKLFPKGCRLNWKKWPG